MAILAGYLGTNFGKQFILSGDLGHVSVHAHLLPKDWSARPPAREDT